MRNILTDTSQSAQHVHRLLLKNNDHPNHISANPISCKNLIKLEMRKRP